MKVVRFLASLSSPVILMFNIDDAQVLRLISPVLANFPWYSALITSCDDLLKLAHVSNAFHNFATSMKGFESTIFDTSTRRNESTTTAQNLLGIGSSGQMVAWNPSKTLAGTDSGKMCSVISAYRLLDVVAMLNGAHRAPSVHRRYFDPPSNSFRVSAKSLWLSTRCVSQIFSGIGQTGQLAKGLGRIPRYA